jgi:cell wall-associated NlpC family hydrolase
VSQALLGDAVTLIAACGGWRRVRTWDDYEGWLAAGTLAPRPAGWGEAEWGEALPLAANLRHAPDYRAAAPTIAFAGARLPLVAERTGWVGLHLPNGAVAWTEKHRVRRWRGPAAAFPDPTGVIQTARQFLGVPYLWGGNSALGLDCSGFVQLVWRLHGIRLPRDAYQQAECGTPLDLDRAVPGDLLFFGPEAGGRDRVTHVAICLGGEMIHAAGSDRVRVDPMDAAPYVRRLLFARRVTEQERGEP